MTIDQGDPADKTSARLKGTMKDLMPLLMVLILWTPAARAICVDEETAFFVTNCRTDPRYASQRNIPENWTILVDTYDFNTLVGTDPNLWMTLDVDGSNDGDSMGQWTEQGGVCQASLRACSNSLTPEQRAAQNNWIFSDYIRFPNVEGVNDFEEMFLELSFRFTQCSTNPGCSNAFVDVYRYDVNAAVSAQSRIDPNNYQFLRGTVANSRLDQGNDQSNVNIRWSFPRSAGTNGLYLAFRDRGTCGDIRRIQLYYLRVPAFTGTLLTCPSVPYPATGSTETTRATCCCGENAENMSTLDRVCSDGGVCVEPASDVCGCSPGYQFSGGVCEACPAGMFQSDISTTSMCMECSANSVALFPAAPACNCTGSTIRNPARPRDPCTEPPSSPLLTVEPVVDGTFVTVCWGAALNSGGLDDLHYNVYVHQVGGTQGAMYNRVNNQPITELCYEITGLNPTSSYAVVVTAANGATGDPDTLDQQLTSVEGQFVAYFVDTGEAGLRRGGAIAVTFFVTFLLVAVITAVIVILIMWFLCVKRNSTTARSASTSGKNSINMYEKAL